MSLRVIFHLTFSALIAASALVLTWLILGDSSPLSEYFLWHVGIPNAWGGLNMIPAIISMLASGNVHAGNELVFYLALTIQWLIIGLLLSFVALLIRNLTARFLK